LRVTQRAIPNQRLMIRLLRTLLLPAVALVVACTPARRELPENNITRNIHFEGNGGSFSGHNDLQLRGQLETEHTRFGLLVWPFMYFVEPKLLKPELLPRDSYRLETWYAHNGWFDARVLGWQLRRIREVGPKRSGVVDILGFVDAGEPSLVRKLEVRGLDGSLKLLGSSAVREGELQIGEQYSLDYAEALRQEILDNLRNHSRAYARVSIGSTAFPSEHVVDVTLLAEPGINTRYGPITISGNEKVKNKVIEAAIPFEMGQTYKYDQLTVAQQRLFGMSTFSIVNVEPDLSDPTQDLVPINVSVTESKFRTFRMGVGGDIDSGQLQQRNGTTLLDPTGISPRVTAGFTHVNLLNQLIRFEADATGGFDFVLVGTEDELQFTYGLRSSLTYPRIAGQRVAIELQGQIIQGVQSGLWGYRRQEGDMHVVWNAYNDVQYRAGPHVEQYVYLFEGPAQSTAARRFFGESFAELDRIGTEERPAYRLTAFDQFLTVDLRDDKFDTTRGAYYSGHLRAAIPVFHQGPFYGSTTLDGRWYRPVRVSKKHRDFPFVLAGGLRGEYLQPLFGREIPFPERAFMGGANSIRGFRQDQVGPYDTICSYDARRLPVIKDSPGDLAIHELVTPDFGYNGEKPEAHYHVAHGGTLAAQASAEIRYRYSADISFATFVDTGILTDGILELDPKKFRASAGVGTRYQSPIGPLRFDISLRPLYAEDEGPTTSVCRIEGHETGRVVDALSSFNRNWHDTLSRPPLAMVFFIAIGESI